MTRSDSDVGIPFRDLTADLDLLTTRHELPEARAATEPAQPVLSAPAAPSVDPQDLRPVAVSLDISEERVAPVRASSAEPLAPLTQTQKSVFKTPRPALAAHGSQELSRSAKRIADWFIPLVRALRAAHFYPTNSPVRAQHFEAAHFHLTQILCEEPHFEVGIRQGRILYGNETVYSDPDDNGLAAILFRNSIFRVAFSEGVTAEELANFVDVIATDFAGHHGAGEDLVTSLWRLELPHIRYHHVDILSLAVSSDLPEHDSPTNWIDDDETRRLRQEIARITGAMRFDHRTGEDVVALFDQNVDTPAARREVSMVSRRVFATALAINGSKFPEPLIASLLGELKRKANHDELVAHLTSLLLDALLKEDDPTAPTPALEFLVQLFSSMIEGHQWSDALRLVEKVRRMGERATSPRESNFADRFLARFSREEYLAEAIRAIDHDGGVEIVRIVAYVRSLGHHAAPALMRLINQVEDAGAREMLCDLLLANSASHRAMLHHAVTSARWEVACLLLSLSGKLSEEERSPIIWRVLEHPHPRPRAAAVRELARFAPGHADEAVIVALNDQDETVRQAALRTLETRRSRQALPYLARLLQFADLGERDPRELKLIFGAYAAIAGRGAVTELQRFVLGSGGILQRKKTTELQAAAAHGLAVVGTEEALSMLQKGARSLNPKLRAACKAALETWRPANAPYAPEPQPSGPRPALFPKVNQGLTPTRPFQNETVSPLTKVAYTIGSGIELYAATPRPMVIIDEEPTAIDEAKPEAETAAERLAAAKDAHAEQLSVGARLEAARKAKELRDEERERRVRESAAVIEAQERDSDALANARRREHLAAIMERPVLLPEDALTVLESASMDEPGTVLERLPSNVLTVIQGRPASDIAPAMRLPSNAILAVAEDPHADLPELSPTAYELIKDKKKD